MTRIVSVFGPHPTYLARKSLNIDLCFFGVIPRSIKKTWSSLKRSLLEPLETIGTVRVYVFNLNVGDTKVDGETLNQADVHTIPADVFEEYSQATLDVEINEKCKEEWRCKYRRDNLYNKPETVQNCFRQMYSEQRVANFLMNSHADVAVVCGPDFYCPNKINLDDVRACTEKGEFVYTTKVNEGMGYTNGFYIGSPANVSKIMTRYDDWPKYMNQTNDYERTVKQAFEEHGIERRVTDMFFWKIRANGKIAWFGGFPEGRAMHLTKTQRDNAKREFDKMKKDIDKK